MEVTIHFDTQDTLLCKMYEYVTGYYDENTIVLDIVKKEFYNRRKNYFFDHDIPGLIDKDIINYTNVSLQDGWNFNSNANDIFRKNFTESDIYKNTKFNQKFDEWDKYCKAEENYVKTRKIKELKYYENLHIRVWFGSNDFRRILIHNGDGYILEIFVNPTKTFNKINEIINSYKLSIVDYPKIILGTTHNFYVNGIKRHVGDKIDGCIDKITEDDYSNGTFSSLSDNYNPWKGTLKIKIDNSSFIEGKIYNKTFEKFEKVKRKNLSVHVRRDCWNMFIGKKYEAKCYAGCGRNITVFNYECGHIKAVAKRGCDDLENLRPICGDCNKRMGTKNMKDYSWIKYGIMIK